MAVGVDEKIARLDRDDGIFGSEFFEQLPEAAKLIVTSVTSKSNIRGATTATSVPSPHSPTQIQMLLPCQHTRSRLRVDQSRLAQVCSLKALTTDAVTKPKGRRTKNN
jgi:hypothetical protein